MRDPSDKITAIRRCARRSLGLPEDPPACPSCNQPASAPYRSRSPDGAITYGCVDAYHTGHLPSTSETGKWHNRPDAIKIRRAYLDGLPK